MDNSKKNASNSCISSEIRQENWRRCLQILDSFYSLCDSNGIDFQLAYGSCLGAVRHRGFIPWDSNLDVTMFLEDYSKVLQLYYEGKFPEDITIVDSENGREEGRQVISIVLKEDNDNAKYLNPNLDISIYCGLSNNRIVRKLEIAESFLNHRVYRLKNVNSIKRKFPWNIVKKLLFIVSNKFLMFRFNRILNRHPISKSRFVTSLATVYGKEVFNRDWIEKSAKVEFEGRLVSVPIGYDNYLSTLYGDYSKPVVYE